MNGDLRFVARLYPCGHFPPQGLEVPDPPVQTLSFQGRNFQLGHVQPTGVLGRRVQAEPFGSPAGFLRRQDQVQGPQGMDIKIVANQVNPLGRGKDLGPAALIRLRSTSRQPRSGASTPKEYGQADLSGAGGPVGQLCRAEGRLGLGVGRSRGS